MNPWQENRLQLARRQFLGRAATGIGTAALAGLLQRDGFAARGGDEERFGGLPGLPHFAPRAKRVIYLFQNGAPTHVDLFDWKPKLQQLHGKPVPNAYIEGRRFSTMTGQADGKLLLAPVEPFAQHGHSGAWVSDLLPHTAAIADELCFVKSMHTEQVNHAPAIQFMLSGGEMPGRPTLGAWLTYGLGCETDELPSFVVMTSITKDTSCGQIFYDFYWGSGFLPSRFQGVKFRGSGDPVLYVSNPDGMSRQMRRGWLDDIAAINEQKLKEFGDPEIATRIAQYEMSFKMQASVPELADLSNESQQTLDMYGPGVDRAGNVRPQLFARAATGRTRLSLRPTDARGLGSAQQFDHGALQPVPRHRSVQRALVQDLKQRGLLEDTLVVWGGEFGRTPFLQGDIKNRPRWGRDHHPYAYTLWAAGGGIRAGTSYGATDDLGINVAENPVHVHDFQATLLHLMGIDHERLTFKFQGRQFRLTDVHGTVVNDILA